MIPRTSPIVEFLNEVSSEARRVEKLGSQLEGYATLQILAEKARQLDTNMEYKKIEASHGLSRALHDIIKYKPKGSRARSWIEDVQNIAQRAIDFYLLNH